ncbi:MAG: polyribonucleotide nucleotidyltransferase [Rickettsiales bacterium]|nr:polyribonucleotide nucleotidyltransferase [Rickettsiales bacterium]
MFTTYTQEVKFGDKTITLETGFLANQADGSVVARCGDTVVLCVVCTAKEDSPDTDFFPLTVNYIEKAYACGKIPGGFYKREGKQSEREILISRLIDRPIRPIFVDGYYRNTQIICTLLSYDGKNEPDIVAMVGASAAVAVAGLPTQGVISACRIGYVDGKYIVNPTTDVMKNSKLDIVVAGTTNAVLMVESEAKILTEDEMLGAIAKAQDVINSSVEQIKDFVAKVGKAPAVIFEPRDRTKLYDKISELAKKKVVEAFKIQNKKERHEALKDILVNLKEDLKNFVAEEPCEAGCECSKKACKSVKGKCNAKCKCKGCKDGNCTDCECCSDINADKQLVFQGGKPVEMNDVDINLMYEQLQSDVVRNQILKDKIRIDGRRLDEVRPIEVRVGVLPLVHGSAVFSRGMTQSMAIATLGTSDDEQQSDSLTATEMSQRFILHYNFPGYSAGEATPPKAPGRRELGHGNLARRALAPVIPSKEEFPYTIRVVSEITSSDGSTSQATVCSSCMAMMDMGVPLKAPVAGVAMGLIKEDSGYAVLTDIMADEDHLGDMDFKVAGPAEGITALQMDIKTFGITMEIMRDALAQARRARLHIMSKMMEALNAPREGLNANAPKIINIQITEKQIPELIGKGGATIKKICETTGSKIDIGEGGLVTVFANNDEQANMTKEMIDGVLGNIEFGKVFDATVKSVLAFGAIVDIGFDRTGLVHISELSESEVADPTIFVKEGDKVKVKYTGKDEKGRLKFSMKAVDQDTGEDKGYELKENSSAFERSDRPRHDRGDRGGRRNFENRDRNDRGERRDRRDDRGERNFRRDKRNYDDDFRNKKGKKKDLKKRKKKFFFF